MTSDPSSVTTPVALIGARGKMGRYAEGLIDGAPDLEVCARIGRGDDLATSLVGSGAAVGLDLTVAGLGADHALAMVAAGIRPVIGTSGVSEEQCAAIDGAARAAGIGGLVVPNFSLGIWLQQHLALQAAAHMDSIEVIEEHHADKVDAPSGTAAHTADLLASATGRESVPIHSVRLAGLHSNQTVLFGGSGEVLRIEHVTYGLGAFGPGILAALRYARTAVGVARGIGPAFGVAATSGAD